jgi:hypothetical protein
MRETKRCPTIPVPPMTANFELFHAKISLSPMQIMCRVNDILKLQSKKPKLAMGLKA